MLHFRRILTLDIFDYSGHKICPLYDSRSDISGQATDVFVIGERNGWKELHFNLQSVVDTEDGKKKNFRLDYLKADYCIRAVDEKETDWFLISEPKITHSGFSQNVEVIAGHVSMLLKQKNLTLVFSDDEGNNVGTPAEFLDVILQGTSWYPGKVTTFYEDNGDIKRRSLSCGEKTGSFKMISDMCELFDAKPVYHGESYVPLTEDPGDMDTRFKAYCTLSAKGEYEQLAESATFEPDKYYRYKVRSVDILPMNPFSINKAGDLPNIYKTNELIDSQEVIELHYGKALKNVTRTLNTENIVTKLFAYGSYGDKVDGYCSIGECEHTEFTYLTTVDIPIGEYGLFYYSDDSGDHHGRFLVSGKPVDVGDTLIYSLMDPASRMYIYNLTKGYAYYVDDDYGGTLVNEDGQPDLTSEETNMANFIMDFTYYYNVGLFTEEMLQELARNQRESPGLRAAANEASAAFNDMESRLSELIGNVDYCRILPTDGSDLKMPYENSGGYLKINLDNDDYKSGILYRSDYFEREPNQFKWYCATELKPNGDPQNNSASAVYIIHDTNPITWNKVYVKTINDIPAYIQKQAYAIGNRVHYAGSIYECITDIPANTDEVWISAHWKLIDDIVPESITLWLDYNTDNLNPDTDRIYLFKSNTVNGYLGSYEAMDESVLNTLRDTTKVTTTETYSRDGEEMIVATEHPTYFIPIPKKNGETDMEALRAALEKITVDENTGYAWCWAYDPEGEIESQLFFYQICYDHMPHDQWCLVCFTGEEAPIPYPNCYWYDWRTGAAYYSKYQEAVDYDAAKLEYPHLDQMTLTKYPFVKLVPQNAEYQDQFDHMITTYSKACLGLYSQETLDAYNNYWLGLYENWKVFAIDQSCDAGYVWEQFNETDTASKAEERLGLNFGAVWAACRQRDRYYQGLYTNYVYAPEEPLPAGNYAFTNPYGTFWAFSAKQPTSDGELNFNTSDGYITQTTAEDGQDKTYSLEVKNVTFDAVKYHSANVMEGITWEEDSSLDEDGGEIAQPGIYRSGFAPIYLGLEYVIEGDFTSAEVYIYNARRRFVKHETITASGQHISMPGEAAFGGFIRITTDDINHRAIRVYYKDYDHAIIQSQNNYLLLDCVPDTTGQLKAIPEFIKLMADYLDELYTHLMPIKTEAQAAVTKLDNEFANALGDIYREGYWQDANYVDGDEDRLYADALENLQHIAKPEATYDIEFVDPYGSNEHVDLQADDTLLVPWPDLNISYAVHLVDPELGINEWAFIDKIEKCYDKPWETVLEINTNLTTIAQHSFADVLENIANIASQLNAKQTKYDQAVIGTGANGQVTAARLEGMIDASRVYITSAASGWRTDDNGNMLFESADGESAMMLAGRGFAIADSKNPSGDWNWRTFGTGHGFTAEEITTGFLSADRIQAGVITVDKLENGIGAAIDLSNNGIVMSVKNGKYDKFNGIAIEEDGIRITTDIADGVVHILLNEEPDDWASNYGSYFIYDNGEYKAVDGSAAPDFETGKYYTTQTIGETRNIISLTGDGINLASGGQINLESGAGMHIESGAAFTVQSPNFTIDNTGDVTISGNVTILGGEVKHNLTVDENVYIEGGIKADDGTVGGWNIGATRLWSGNTSTFVALDVTPGNNYAIWAGAESAANAPFSVTRGGTLHATQAEIEGEVTATTGRIGGYEIASGILSTGTGTSFVALDGSDSSYALWAGNETAADAPFYVTKAGALHASDADITGNINATTGTIGGWTIDSDGLMRAGANTTYVALDPRSSTNYAFWAGSETPTLAKFRVDKDGTLHATGADISGSISVQAGGTIGGFTIGDSSLYTNAGVSLGTSGITLGNTFSVTSAGVMSATSGYIGGWTVGNGYLYSGSGNTYVRLDSTANPGYAMWAGAEAPTTSYGGLVDYAPFCVTSTGTLHASDADISGKINATSGKIGNWSITTDGLLTGSYFISEMGVGDVTYSIAMNPTSFDGVIKLTKTMPSGVIGDVFSLSLDGNISTSGAISAGSLSASGDVTATGNITGKDISASSGYIYITPSGTRNTSRIIFGSSSDSYPRLVCRTISSTNPKMELVWLWASGSENTVVLAKQT